EADIIDLIVPPPAQPELLDIALAAQPRAIICQKPFGPSIEVAKQMCARAEAAGIPLIVHENFRFQPWYRRAKAEIAAGTLGDLHQVTFRLRTGDGQGPGAYLDRQPYFQTMPRLLIHETAVHWVDTFRYLMGPIRAVQADLRRMNPAIAGEDAGYVIFHFDDGRRALFDGNRHLDHAADNHRLTLGEAMIEGTNGTLTLDGQGALSRRAFGTQEAEVILSAQAYDGFAGDCVHALQRHVIDALAGRAPFENLASDYMVVRRVEAAIYEAAETGAKVEVPDG
ncbi:MAG: Gfo/Idh/MocA family oxidoreductase, partial [Pseudomonadota bacterium]